MTTPSNEELQRLLDEATPGEWEFHEDKDYDEIEFGYPAQLAGIINEVAADGVTLFNHANADVLLDYPGNLRIAALARDLAAEVIRLREDIEALREELSELGDENLMIAPPDKRVAYREAARACTRILEGDQA